MGLPKSKLVSITAALGSAVLVVHFAFTLVYTFPGVPVPKKAQELSYAYMVPMFHQGWKLFAPDITNYNLTVSRRCYSQGKWEDRGAIDQNMAHSRLPYALSKITPALTTSLNDSLRGLYYVDNQARYDRVTNGGAFKAVVYYLLKEESHRMGAAPDSIQLTLTYTFTPDLRTGEAQEEVVLEFPSVHIPDGP